MHKLKQSISIRPEIFIMIVIIVCVTFIMHYDRNERAQGVVTLSDDGSIVILHDDEKVNEYKTNGRPLVDYQPETCMKIEVFDKEMDTVFRILFYGSDSEYRIVDTDKKLREMYMNMESGHRAIPVKDDVYDVYFQWGDDEYGSEYLIVYISSQVARQRLQRFMIICYVTIILCFVMLTNSIYWQCKGIANRYKAVRKEMASRLIQR